MRIPLKTDFRGSPPRPFKRGAMYYIRLTFGDKDVWRSCRTKSRSEAEKYAYEVWYQLQRENVREMLQPPGVMIKQAIDEYKKSERFSMLKNSTKRMRLSNANKFVRYCKAHNATWIDDITPSFCESFLNTCGKTSKTFNNVRSDLIQLLDQTTKRLSVKNPFEQVPQRIITRGVGVSKPKAAFTDEQIESILSYIQTSRKMQNADEWLRACKIAMYTGLRLEDICLLRYDEITDDILEVTPKKTESITKKKILLRLPSAVKPEIFGYRLRQGYVLPSLAARYPKYDGEGKLVSGMYDPARPFMKVIASLKMKPPAGYSIGFHSFRVTLVTKLRQAGYSAEVIGGIVGHTSAVQTEHYNRAALSIDVSKISYSEAK